jgi:hypothetical protein
MGLLPAEGGLAWRSAKGRTGRSPLPCLRARPALLTLLANSGPRKLSGCEVLGSLLAPPGAVVRVAVRDEWEKRDAMERHGRKQ